MLKTTKERTYRQIVCINLRSTSNASEAQRLSYFLFIVSSQVELRIMDRSSVFRTIVSNSTTLPKLLIWLWIHSLFASTTKSKPDCNTNNPFSIFKLFNIRNWLFAIYKYHIWRQYMPVCFPLALWDWASYILFVFLFVWWTAIDYRHNQQY